MSILTKRSPLSPLQRQLPIQCVYASMRFLLPLNNKILHRQTVSCALQRSPAGTLNFKPRFVSTMPGTSSFPPEEVRAIANEVAALLRERGETVSVAETAAGGIISASILSTPGASKIYKGGLTLYTLESRIAYAGWTKEYLASYDGPTPDLVAGMARHVRGTLGSTYTISESGTAGPTASGKAVNRQPGYVALAVSSEKGDFKRELFDLGSDREVNMVTFTVEALKLLLDVIKGDAKL